MQRSPSVPKKPGAQRKPRAKKEKPGLFTQAYNWFFDIKQQRGRAKTLYEGNYTASLALPDVPKRAQPACKPPAAELSPIVLPAKPPEKTYKEIALEYASAAITEAPNVIIPAANQAYQLLWSLISSAPAQPPTTNVEIPAAATTVAPILETAPPPKEKKAKPAARKKKPVESDDEDDDYSAEDNDSEEDFVPQIIKKAQTVEEAKKPAVKPSSLASDQYDFTPHAIDELIAGLSQTFKRVKEHDQKEAVLLAQIEQLEFQIKEHAARRIDLIFYLMMAMYGREVVAEKIHTNKQHGEGTKKMALEGCHSCLFPSIQLSKPSSGSKLWDLASSTYDRITSNTFEDIMTRHLGESFNITAEMISLVNDFDQFVEGHSIQGKEVKAILEICNNVSHNKIDPMEGMSAVLAVFRNFFNRFEEEHLSKNPSSKPKGKQPKDPHARREKDIKYKNAMRKIMHYEAVGTFDAANAAGKIDPNYIYLLLRLKPEEIAKVKQDPLELKTYYLRMRDEIYAHASTVKKTNPTPGMKI